MCKPTYILKCAILLIIILTSHNWIAFASSEENILVSRAIIPNMNITFADETFYIRELPDLDKLMIYNNEEHINLEINKSVEWKGYEFKLLWRRFDWEKLGMTDALGTPLFGTIEDKTDKKIYTYLLQIKLLKPILEFEHSINIDEANLKINKPFNITTRIKNLGKYGTTIKFTEPLHQGLKVDKFYSNNKSIQIINNNDKAYPKAIYLESEIEDEIEIKYQVIPELAFTQNFDSKATYIYDDIKYNVREKEPYRFTVKPHIEFSSGIWSQKYYNIKSWKIEIGDSYNYGVSISNPENWPTEKIELEIDFSKELDVEIKNSDNSFILYDNYFNEDFILNNSDSKTFVFHISPKETGEHNITMSLISRSNGKKILNKETTKIIGVKEPLIPKIIINSSEENKTAQALLYIINPNKRTNLKELNLIIQTQFGEDIDIYEYNFPEIDIESSYLINKFNTYIYNSSNDMIAISGSFRTKYDEIIPFKIESKVNELDSNEFYKISGAISQENFLDLQYEEQMAIYDRKRPLTFSEKMQSFTKSIITVQESKNNFLIPLAVGGILIIIQITQFMKQKNKNN